MFDWKDFEVHKNILSQAGPEVYYDHLGQHHVTLRPQDLLKWIEFLKNDLGYLTLVDMAGVDRSQLPDGRYRFELIYLLFNMGSHQRVNLHVHFNDGEIIPGISKHYLHAEWLEREQAEMLGIAFSPLSENLLLPKGSAFFPLRKDSSYGPWPADEEFRPRVLRVNPNKSEAPYPEESWRWKQYDLLSLESRGLFEWQVCFDPVKVVESRTRIGLHHRGWEKILESKSWAHILVLSDLIHVGAAPTYSVGWARNLEDLLRIKLPERAQAIRIVMLELARVADHLTVLQEMTYTLQKDEHRLFLDAREKILELFEKYCGHRRGLGLVSLGGVREDLPHGWIIEYQIVADILMKNLRLIHRSLLSQRDFRSEIDHSGVNAQTVLQWGVSGPAMRASGLNFDLRKSQPFYFYQDIDFDVPVGIHGTSYDRYLIRYEEIFQSLRIITQVLDNLPLGEIGNPNYAQAHLRTDMKLGIPAGAWHYSSLESPSGEAGFFHLPGEGSAPYRLKIKTPGFTLSQALPEFIKGLEEKQLSVALASLGIRKSEQDR